MSGAIETHTGPDQPTVRRSTDHNRCGMVLNAFTVDLEDWAHGLLGGDTPITSRVIGNVERVLTLLDAFGVRATFFALGRVCRKFPCLLPRVAAAGHEIASHGDNHQLVYNLTPQQFRDDVRRSIDTIGEQTGRAPIGYRAPAFSITMGSLWAGPLLQELGFEYSSSIFPFPGSRYGIAEAPPHPFRWSQWARTMSAADPRFDAAQCGLVEFPLTTLRCGRRRWPACGGGYLRLCPAWFHRVAIDQAHRRGHPAVLYMHPYELDLHEIRDLVRDGWHFERAVVFKQALFRRQVKPRLCDLLGRYRFAPMSEVLQHDNGFRARNPRHNRLPPRRSRRT